MEYVYAALLLHKLDQEVKEENVKKVMTAAGAKPNEAKVKALIAALEDVNIDEALKSAVLTSAPAAAPAAGAPAGDAAASEAPPAEEDKGKKEEEALEGLSSLFG